MAEYKLFIKDFYSLLYIARLAAAKFSVLAKKSLVIYMREIALCMLKKQLLVCELNTYHNR